MLGYPISKKLVFDPFGESDLQCAFYCTLASKGQHDLVTVYLQDRNTSRSRFSSVFVLTKVDE